MPPKATTGVGRAALPFVRIETPRITRSAALKLKTSDPNGTSAKIPMGINCICGHNFINPSDTLMLCEKCSFWSHQKCVGLSNLPAHEVAKMKFLCPFCSGDLVKRSRVSESGKSCAPEGMVNNKDEGRHLSSPPAVRSTVTRVKLEEVPDKNPQASVASLIQATLSLLIADLEANSDVTLEFIPPLLPSTMLPRYPAEGEGVVVGNFPATSQSSETEKDGRSPVENGSQKINERSTSETDASTSSGHTKRRRINLSAAVARNTSVQNTVENAAKFSQQSFVPSPSPSSTSAANALSTSSSVCSAHSYGAARCAAENSDSVQELGSAALAAAALNSLSPDDLAPHENPFYPKKFYNTLTDEMILECLECCKSAIANATFSESYPEYCLRELQAFPHKYLQGTFARCNKTKKVVAFILTNGMDEYGNLKSSLSQLRQAHNKALSANGIPTSAPSSAPTSPASVGNFAFPLIQNAGHPLTIGGVGTTVTNTAFTEECLKIVDINDFVHVTLVATHENHRGRGLAKKLMLADSLRWLIRGRTRAYLNMALERLKIPLGARLINGEVVLPTSDELRAKSSTALGSKRGREHVSAKQSVECLEEAVTDYRLSGEETLPESLPEESPQGDASNEVEDEFDVVCIASESSRRLYTAMGFTDVVPSKIDPETNEVKWTPKEEEGGKVMANLDMKESARTVSRQIFGDTAPLYSGRKVLKLKK